MSIDVSVETDRDFCQINITRIQKEVPCVPSSLLWRCVGVWRSLRCDGGHERRLIANAPDAPANLPLKPVAPANLLVRMVLFHRTVKASTHQTSRFGFCPPPPCNPSGLHKHACSSSKLVADIFAACFVLLLLLLPLFSRRHAMYDAQDDDEPVDPLTGIREKCGETKPCAAAMTEYKVRATRTYRKVACEGG